MSISRHSRSAQVRRIDVRSQQVEAAVHAPAVESGATVDGRLLAGLAIVVGVSVMVTNSLLLLVAGQ
jgi:hypothetical protein